MNNVKSYTDKQLLEKVKSLKSFKTIPSDYWIVGVRSNEDAPNKFDDKFYIFKGESFITVLSGTTNPGTPVLEGGFLKYNKAGAAVIKADEWYYSVWKYGLHKGVMPALVQIGKFLGFRDGDKDKKSEEIGPLNTFEWTGINFHTISNDADAAIIADNVNGWSAGCQVVNDNKKFRAAIKLYFQKQKSVSYVLLNEF